ncbi:hypothetical protein [Rhodopirellula sp. MGV]|uniref:hypothetical protein n=1 Tax=Rhodopirellula sp. MGV TaxID=2023130 RepID=UPI000B974B1C|nr:hypothetical protein [Rhodopirellula sp. MGV]OYP31603.1 hypothetical protein CGZ80_21175 [Rhodopirellula sp. MGV]PNY36330.1 hypothetical protein C2E31_13655 [Rhodopirellula baltica]PNY37710.1 hypothetical protein C2E31_06115 [Rhodopirellula baltica]
MCEIKICGYCEVTDQNRRVIDDEQTLRCFNKLEYCDERPIDNLFDGDPEELALIQKLISGGTLVLEYLDSENVILATTGYTAKEELSDSEIQKLISFTSGHWVDGFGSRFCEDFLQDQGYRLELNCDARFQDAFASVTTNETTRFFRVQF